MKAIMYGAGNIGRGFIGEVLYKSGFETVFIDVNSAVVDGLNREGKYPLYLTKNTGYEKTWVSNLRAVSGRDENAVIEEIVGTDLLCTALGVNILPYVAALLARGVLARKERTNRPLNILICENLIGSNKYLHGLVEKFIPECDKEWFEANIGFVCVSVGRVVPPTPPEFTAENPLTVCAEPYYGIPVDAAGFRPVGCEYPKINGLVPFSPFDFFIERKLLVHNMAHAMCAYVGSVYGYEYIYEASMCGDIKYLLTRAMIESARALAKRHGAPLDDVIEFVEELIPRFENPMLIDSLARVGKDTKRKLSKNDRLVGAYKMVKESGGTPAHIAVGIAAGLLFSNEGDEAAIEISSFTKENGVAAALAKYSDITDPADVAVIERFYKLLSVKASFTEIGKVLTELKTNGI